MKFQIFFIFCSIKLYSELLLKIPFKGSEALSFFRNRGKFENHLFSSQPLPKLAENCEFLFARKDQRDYIYQCTLNIYDSACLGLSEALS